MDFKALVGFRTPAQCFYDKRAAKENDAAIKTQNKLNRERNHGNCCNFNQQHSRYLNTLRKSKKQYFNGLNIIQVSDNKIIWKNIKPFISDRWSNSFKLTLLEENNEEQADII